MTTDFHLTGFSDAELDELRSAVEVEQKTRAHQSRLAAIDRQIARLRSELPSAPARHDNVPRPLLYSGGELRQSLACHCRWCIQGEIGVLENRRQVYMAEVQK
jgi:hypothetical protein